ncbi:TPA_inf: hypothetical protein gp_19 [Marinomonas phage YY]|nr:TPA_inf: hypothetical protein gp_19 [Marinomonas phage YY]
MTTKRAPKWQRVGFANEAEYRAACAATRRTKKAAFLATGAKLAHRLVLEVMWQRADFHRPFVKLTKRDLMEDSGLCLKTVQRSLKFLRDEGSVFPASGWEGGSGKATLWALRVPGSKGTPADEQIEQQKDKRDREATWRFLKDKYGPLKALEIMGPPDSEENSD